MEEQKQNINTEQEIDLLELARKLWDNRRLIIKWCIIGAVAGLIIGFSIPKEYTTTVKLSPEVQGAKSSMGGGLSSLASMAGVNLNSMSSADAVYPELYPDVVSSIPFATELFDVPVSDKKGELQTTVYDYVSEYIRFPWWSAILKLPGKAIGGVMSLFKEEEEPTSDTLNTFQLTKEETKVVKALNERIGCTVDKKTNVIILSVTMQDPLISAVLTDTVMNNLQSYITDYRTNKARKDLEYTQMLFDEARMNYHTAQQIYADYMDKNQNIVLHSVRAEQERLRNEMSLAYNLYNQMAQQLQMAKAKVQEQVPVYTVIQPATVPLKASSPSKLLLLIGFIFLSGVFASGWILVGEDMIKHFKNDIQE